MIFRWFGYLFVALLLAAPAGAAAPAVSAWQSLSASRPDVVRHASSSERVVLEALTLEQLEAWLEGTPPEAILLTAGESLAQLLARKVVGGDFELTRYALSGGATATASGGGFTLSGILGQPEVGAMSGGVFTLTGGFRPSVSPTTGLIFRSGFESGDLSDWNGP